MDTPGSERSTCVRLHVKAAATTVSGRAAAAGGGGGGVVPSKNVKPFFATGFIPWHHHVLGFCKV
jgi:aldehyde:ferredoxin oxidoreductase